MMSTVMKGDIAELVVAADLGKRGHQVAFPFTSSCDWDLLLIRGEPGPYPASCSAFHAERVQVKYAEIKDGVIPVRCRTHSNTSSKQIQKSYTPEMIDWLAVYEPTNEIICYIPSRELSASILHLRVDPPKSKRGNQSSIKWAHEYMSL